MKNILKLVRFLWRSSGGMHYSRASVVMVVLAGVVAGVVSTGLLALINRLLNAEDPASWLAWGFAALCVLLPFTRFLSQYLLVRLTQGLAYELRLQLSRKILAAPLRQLETVGPGRLLATLTDDVGTITGTLTNLPLLSLQFAVVLSCLGYMGWLSLPLLGWVLIVVVIGVASYQLPLLRAVHHFRIGRDRADQLFSHLRGLTDGAKELKMHRARRRDFFSRQLEPAVEGLRHHNLRGGTIYALVNSWGQVLFFVLIGLLLLVFSDTMDLDRATLTGYTLAILYLLTPLDVILNLLPGLGRAAVAVDKVEGLGLSLESGDVEAGEAVPAISSWQRIDLDGLCHSYYREDRDDSFTLGPLDMTLRPGELVFIVGGNGSGKTTLAKLLVGLYAAEAGDLRIDGRPVGEEERDEYRQLFSVVFSDFHLFDLLLGLERPELDDSARHYLEVLHLAHKVRVEEGTLSTLELSQGQRKRLALLTAYLEDRPIYLFDEWAADQDPYFKEIFYHQLLPELRRRGKTVVVISHDDRYYSTADRVVKLEEGRIVFDGRLEDQSAELPLAAV